jgi:hypothetical protein
LNDQTIVQSTHNFVRVLIILKEKKGSRSFRETKWSSLWFSLLLLPWDRHLPSVTVWSSLALPTTCGHWPRLETLLFAWCTPLFEFFFFPYFFYFISALLFLFRLEYSAFILLDILIIFGASSFDLASVSQQGGKNKYGIALFKSWGWGVGGSKIKFENYFFHSKGMTKQLPSQINALIQ